MDTIKPTIFEYFLRLGDSSLILGHRLSEWCGHAPILEEDIALTNISLDLVGQARTLLTFAGETEGRGRTEDDLAYRRDERHFRNVLLVEQPNGDFGCTIVRQFLFSAFTALLWEELKMSNDTRLAAFAEKALKEVTYHLRHSSEWLIRLGDGTQESHRRMQDAVDGLWRCTGDMFEMSDAEHTLVKEGLVPDATLLKPRWDKNIAGVFSKANLAVPQNVFMMTGSHEGKHTEHLGYLLAEMQFLPRSYPGAKW